MAVYTKTGRRILAESIRIDSGCYYGETLVKIRARAFGARKEKLYWTKELLADGGPTEVQAMLDTILKEPEEALEWNADKSEPPDVPERVWGAPPRAPRIMVHR